MDMTKYIADFQIVGSRIVKLKIKNDFIVLDSQEKVKRRIDISHEISRVDDDGQGGLVGLVVLNVSVRIQNAGKSFQLDISTEGCFTVPNNFEREKFENMLGINGITALYGITRSAVLSISSQAFIQGNVVLPMINVYEYSKDITVKKAE